MNDKAIAENQAEPLDPSDDASAEKPNGFLKNVFLFFISPFVAIAYAAALPFVGFFMFSKLGHEANRRRAIRREKRRRKRLKKASK